MPACTPIPSWRDRLILLDGWSKTYAMTGWRLGYGVWPKALLPHAERLAINCHSCVNAAAQYAGIAAMTGPREPSRGWWRPSPSGAITSSPALNALPGFACANPGGAFYAFPNIGETGFDSPDAASRGCWTRPAWRPSAGTSFGALAKVISASPTPRASTALKEAVDRIEAWLGSQNTDARTRRPSRARLHAGRNFFFILIA